MSSMHREFSEENPSSEKIKMILDTYQTVAIVGLSPKPARASYQVAEYLKGCNYQIVPVNPGQREILGQPCYPDLRAIPFEVEIVDIFRKPDAIPLIVDDAIAIGAKVVWMQLGIFHHKAAEKARQAGLDVVMDRCIKIEHGNILKADKK